MSDLSPQEFLSGVAMLTASLGRYSPGEDDQVALGQAWLRTVYPHVKRKAQWEYVLDILISTEQKFPTPHYVIDLLDMNSAHGAPSPKQIASTYQRRYEPDDDVVAWIRANPRRDGEGALSYIDRIAVGTGLIAESLLHSITTPRGTEPPQTT